MEKEILKRAGAFFPQETKQVARLLANGFTTIMNKILFASKQATPAAAPESSVELMPV